MKNVTIKTSLLMLAMGLTIVSGSSLAQGSSLRSESPHFIEDGWDVRLGAGLTSTSGEFYQGMDDENALTILLDVNYSRGNFFFSATEEDGLLLGYSVVRDENWVVDAVFGPKFGVDFEDSDEFDGQLEHLGERDIDGHLGARFSWYGDANRVSASLTGDVTGAHDGFLASLDYQHQWQLRNWLLTGRAGLSLFSDNMTNHMAGVNVSEATTAFAQYEAGAGKAALLELTVEYPVNENWIFETKASVGQFSSEFEDSPIVDDNKFSVVTSGFKYQF